MSLTGPLQYRYTVPCDFRTRFGHYLYSMKCSWIIKVKINYIAGYDKRKAVNLGRNNGYVKHGKLTVSDTR